MVDNETKLKATEIIGIAITESNITINWSNKFLGFGRLVYAHNGSILDDEGRGKEFSEYVLSLYKKNFDRKTLLISMYDCSTEYSAATIDRSGIVTPIDISRNMIYAIYDRYHLMHAGMSLDKDEQKKLVKLTNLLNDYTHVVVCEDGKIEQLK